MPSTKYPFQSPLYYFRQPLATGDGTARRGFFRKVPAPLGAFFVDPAHESARVQHGAALAGMVGETHPPAAISCRGDFCVDTKTGRLGLEAQHLFARQAPLERGLVKVAAPGYRDVVGVDGFAEGGRR